MGIRINSKLWGILCLAGTGLALSALSGCQTQVAGMTLPSGCYLQHPPQYIQPTPYFPLSKETARLEETSNIPCGNCNTPQQLPPPVPGGGGYQPAPQPLPGPAGYESVPPPYQGGARFPDQGGDRFPGGPGGPQGQPIPGGAVPPGQPMNGPGGPGQGGFGNGGL